jgi:DNA-binding response OmpR family regulator
MANKVLVVDDDLNFRNGLSVRLRSQGYTSVFAADGASAVAVARRELPNLILLDIGLPGGDGFVVLQRLRSLPSIASIPVIVMTARPIEDTRDRALAAGAVGFLHKPLDNDELTAAVRHWDGVERQHQ